MRMPRIHEAQALGLDQTLALSEGNCQHLAQALRLEPGAGLRVFDGRGNEFAGTVTEAGKRRMTVRLTERVSAVAESPVRVTLGLGMSLGDRMEYAIQKATELGVTEIVPVQAARSELKLGASRAARKQERWQRVAISASEQCGRAVVPSVALPVSTAQWLARLPAQATGLFLHHENSVTLGSLSPPEHLHALIGPEGGLSDDELEQCRQSGLTGVRLGPRVLRTETAPVVLLSAVQTLWGDFGT